MDESEIHNAEWIKSVSTCYIVHGFILHGIPEEIKKTTGTELSGGGAGEWLQNESIREFWEWWKCSTYWMCWRLCKSVEAHITTPPNDSFTARSI